MNLRSISKTALLLSFAAFALAACGNDALDDDASRGLAKPIALGQVQTDSIAPPDDTYDWKVVEVPGKGFLTVSIFWDNANLESTVAMLDNFGNTLQAIRRDSRSPKDQMIVKCDGEKSTFYYIKIASARGSSTYSVQTSFSGAGTTTLGDDEPIPEFVAPIDPGSEGEVVQ